MIHSSKMTDSQFIEFVRIHSVSGACGSHGAENAAAAQQSQFTNSMISEGQQVFGQDSSVFNTLVGNYSPIVKAGPSQAGYSAAESNALNAAAIQNVAAGYRNVAGATKAGLAGMGGGNTLTTSGAGLNANVAVGEAAANAQAGALNKIQQENWAQGHQNWLQASQGLRQTPDTFNNMSGFNASAQEGLKQNMANAQAKDAASNWWVKPLESGAMFAGNMMAPGLSSAFSSAIGQGGGGLDISGSGIATAAQQAGTAQPEELPFSMPNQLS